MFKGEGIILGLEPRHKFSSVHQILSSDTLKELAADPYSTVGEPFWFGVGFAKIRLSTTLVLNFWPGGGQEPSVSETEMHTHRYSFESVVLRGTLRSYLYETGRVDQEAEIPAELSSSALAVPSHHTHVAERVTCLADGSLPTDRPLEGYCTPRMTWISDHQAGDRYWIDGSTYHVAVAPRPTVTLLHRPSGYETPTARVLRPVSKPAECAYADTDRTDAWHVIEEVLAAPIGYHTQPIPKGTVGEVSGIEEEFLEFLDAVSPQRAVRNPVLALCELSDMIGATKEYLAKNFPGLTFQDLEEMARATRGSFLSGERG